MSELFWWQRAVFYQIYPRSFADGNGDGIGDFKGMIARLDHLHSLGIDAVWLSPHYPSPNADCGYDISSYTDVAPEYGTLDDFQAFLDGAHRRNIRVILDLVLNHTSDQHSWFQESRSSRANPKRDWYIWKDPAPGGSPPNNWNSAFDGPAWTLDPLTGQYYYHLFLRQQPDLNWKNPQVKAAMFAAVRFWLDLGVDGYRLDAIGTIFEDPGARDHPLGEMTLPEIRRKMLTAGSAKERDAVWGQWQAMFQYQVEQPGVHTLMQELRALVDEYGPGQRVLVGENEQTAYYGDGSNELHMVFNFPLMKVDKLTPEHIRRNQQQRLAELATISPDAWPCNTLGNHDESRMYSRYGDGVHDAALARLHLALLLTLKGTPFLYNGEEIGMTDLELEDISQFRDTMAIWQYQAEVQEPGVDLQEALKRACRLTRDRSRSPMQWDGSPNAGFCPPGVQPWLPVHPNYAQGVNVQAQQQDPGSLMNDYRRLLRLRRETPALVVGEYIPLDAGDPDGLVFLRQAGSQTCLAALNFSGKTLRLDLDRLRGLPQFSGVRQLFPVAANLGDEKRVVVPGFTAWIGELI